MLYNKDLVEFNTEKEEFIFDTLPYNEDIDIRDIAVLEGFFKEKGYIPERYINLFLNYVTYYARSNCVNEIESPLTSSLKGKCSITAKINEELLKKMALNVKQFNIGNIFGDYYIHQLTMVEIPTMINGEIKIKSYLLDPTFRQFCLKEENRFERYYEEPRFSVRMSTPHPGYFLNLTEEGKKFAEDLIYFGYFEVNEESVKRYCDAFALYLKPKEAYEDMTLLGKISSTNISGDDYIKKIISILKNGKIRNDKVVLTPMEIIEIERKRLKNRLKYFVTRKDEFDSELDLEEESLGMKM